MAGPFRISLEPRDAGQPSDDSKSEFKKLDDFSKLFPPNPQTCWGSAHLAVTLSQISVRSLPAQCGKAVVTLRPEVMESLHSKGTVGQPLCCSGYADHCLEQNSYRSGSAEGKTMDPESHRSLHPRLCASWASILPPETYMYLLTPPGPFPTHRHMHPSVTIPHQPRSICSPKLADL